MLAREGMALIAVATIIAGLLLVSSVFISRPWSYVPVVLGILIWVFTLYFFRDPKRVPPPESVSSNAILAPADGKVVLITDLADAPYVSGKAQQMSIFLSPLNVHVNRVPADGSVEYVRYLPGEYLVAWHPKASEKNEQSQIGLRHPSGHRVLFKQIAGAVARRIVFHLSEGDEVKAGDRFGIVKFGSRMDVIVPVGSRFTARIGDKVRAGETIIGYLPPAEAPRMPSTVTE